jgi:hypothetical protein
LKILNKKGFSPSVQTNEDSLKHTESIKIKSEETNLGKQTNLQNLDTRNLASMGGYLDKIENICEVRHEICL